MTHSKRKQQSLLGLTIFTIGAGIGAAGSIAIAMGVIG